MFDIELVKEILNQILNSALRIERRFSSIDNPEDFLSSNDGIDRLDGICMMLIAIGEALKNLDKVTDGELLNRYSEVDWKGAKGVRDVITHHYFDLNAHVIFTICKERMPALIETVRRMIQEVT